jgi:hypothetical protein
MSTERVERSYRGISVRLAIHYLEALGGDQVGPGRVEGPDWTADLAADTASVGPTLTLTEVTVSFEGDGDRLDDLVARFSRKAMRAGG